MPAAEYLAAEVLEAVFMMLYIYLKVSLYRCQIFYNAGIFWGSSTMRGRMAVPDRSARRGISLPPTVSCPHFVPATFSPSWIGGTRPVQAGVPAAGCANQGYGTGILA